MVDKLLDKGVNIEAQDKVTYLRIYQKHYLTLMLIVILMTI
jgi:hypothetical protein